MSAPPAILLAFANDWVDDRRHLRSLLEESNAIGEALAPLVEAGVLSLPPPIHNAKVGDVLRTFRERRHRDRIRIFHFGGHASGSKLMFEDEAGAQTAAHANGLAGYMGRQRGLVLVFLNGCCTEAQVQQLRAAGVKAVVATTAAIQDTVAAEFATAFYAELATRTLRDAFETAEQAVRTRWGDNPRAVTRDVLPPDELETPRWPWILDCDPDYEAWTPSSGREPDHSWRRRLLFAAAVMSLLLTTSLIVSAEARRTTCRVPGLRSLCAAVGIGDVPTANEQASWENALGQDPGDGLRAYLRDYPQGAHADEARSRLAGCWIEHMETRGAERVIRYEWPVPRSPPRPTEAEARREALKRGKQEAETYCKSLGFVHLLSAQITPHDDGWNCTESDHQHSCRFDGEIVCRVQNQIKSALEHCLPSIQRVTE